MQYEDLIVETHGSVALIRLNRPKALNALNDRMMNELGDALYKFDADASIGCIVLTGSEKAFAAGADIAAMADYTYTDTYRDNYITRNWSIFCASASRWSARWPAMRWAAAASW